MCLKAPKVSAAAAPAAPAPAPGESSPTTLKFNEATANADNAENAVASKRRGRKALRIDRSSSSSMGGSSGLNIPS